jgi:hypothetical protein
VCVELFCLKLFILAIIPALVVAVAADVPSQTLVETTLSPDEAGEDHGSCKATAEEWEDYTHKEWCGVFELLRVADAPLI